MCTLQYFDAQVQYLLTIKCLYCMYHNRWAILSDLPAKHLSDMSRSKTSVSDLYIDCWSWSNLHQLRKQVLLGKLQLLPMSCQLCFVYRFDFVFQLHQLDFCASRPSVSSLQSTHSQLSPMQQLHSMHNLYQQHHCKLKWRLFFLYFDSVSRLNQSTLPTLCQSMLLVSQC